MKWASVVIPITVVRSPDATGEDGPLQSSTILGEKMREKEAKIVLETGVKGGSRAVGGRKIDTTLGVKRGQNGTTFGVKRRKWYHFWDEEAKIVLEIFEIWYHFEI